MESDAGHLRVHRIVVDGLGDIRDVHRPRHLFKRAKALTNNAGNRDDARAVLGDVGLGDFPKELGKHIREAELLRKDAVIVSLGRVDEKGFTPVQAVE